MQAAEILAAMPKTGWTATAPGCEKGPQAHTLPAIETGNENVCIIYYLHFEFFARKGLTGAAGNVEKMLKPLKMRTFQVRSPDDLRRALAKVLEEVGHL
jgi:hypothetical protein